LLDKLLQLWRRLLFYLRRDRCSRELEEEMRFHLELKAKENLAAGVSPEEARYAAQRQFGNQTLLREVSRDMWSFRILETLAQDLRYALRMLRKNPGFALLAVHVMGLGIGANTAVFSVVNAVLIRPLAYRAADRIVALSTSERKDPSRASYVSAPDFHDWQDQSRSFDAMAYYRSGETAVIVGSVADYANVARVSAEFFRVFDVGPLAGRSFTSEETKAGSGGAALLSNAYWQSRFGGRGDALGQTIHVFGKTLTVVGILPPGFQFPDKTEIWIPTNTIIPDAESRAGLNRQVVGLLKEGVSLEHANSEMVLIAARLEQQYPKSNEGRTVAVVQLRDDLVRNVRLTLYLLQGTVGLVLLIACANVATLLLAKATDRTREIAIRASMGASRGRIVRQLITESLLLAILGGCAGVMLAFSGSAALVALAPADVPRLADAGIDVGVLGFTFGISIFASLIFGLVPSIYASRVDLNEALKQGAARAGAGGRVSRIRRGLVVTEIAFSVILLTGAGLLIKSFITLNNVSLGFQPENVLVAGTSVQAVSNLESQRRATLVYTNILAEIRSMPEVSAAGAMLVTPGHRGPRGTVWGDFLPKDTERKAPSAGFSVITPGTFAALGIPQQSGRDFDDRDTYDATFTVIVNKALAQLAFPGQDPLGRTIFCGLDDAKKPLRIVGVVGDFRQYGPASEPIPEIYLPYEQHPNNATALKLLIRTATDQQSLSRTLRQRLQERDIPVKFTTMEALIRENIAAPRFRTLLLAIFAGLAVSLAMAGIYGVLAYLVAQRAKEIGLRIALGANRGDVLKLVVRQGAELAAIGLTIGLAGSFTAARVLAGVLYDVKPTDPMTYAAVAGFLWLATLAASYIPARRATKIDPMMALRHD
jgi:putative ABC transport system permease protein